MVTILMVVSWKGHHPSYCAELIRACDAFSRKIVVLCPAGADPVERVGGPAPLTAKVSVVRHSNRAAQSGFMKHSDLAADLRELRARVGEVRRANPGEPVFVFHTSLDSLFIGAIQLPLLWWRVRRLMPWPFSGLMLAPDRRWPLRSARRAIEDWAGTHPTGIKRAARACLTGALTSIGAALRAVYLWQRNRVIARSRCAHLAVQDERYAEWLHRATGKTVHLYPETTSTEVDEPAPKLVRRISEQRGDRIVVGLLGELSLRKCADVLLKMIRRLDTSGLLFVIAGECNPAGFPAEAREFLNGGIRERTNVIYSPSTIPTESEFNAVVRSCDIIYALYRDHPHSSNVVSKAAIFGKPLLVSAGELMAKRVREYALGMVLDEPTPENCLAALRRMSGKDFLERHAAKTQRARYRVDHSLESLSRLMRVMAEATTPEAKK